MNKRNEFIEISLPLDKEKAKTLKAGDRVLLNGEMLTARDAAHKRMFNSLKFGDKLPFPLNDETIFYVGPCFDECGGVTGAGPTTSMRMDAYAPAIYGAGVIATVGKGDRNKAVYDAIKERGGVYFAAIGGAGAIYANAIRECDLIAYDDLGTEAVRKIRVEAFPVIVAIDADGNSIYQTIN